MGEQKNLSVLTSHQPAYCLEIELRVSLKEKTNHSVGRRAVPRL